MTNNNLVMWTKSRKSLLISILLLGATFSYAQTIQWTGGSGRYYITPTNTRIGIGTTNPLYNLDVRGTIRANEIIVNNVTGADFVFEKSYKLRPLSEVQSFIQKNQHLPEIPSAAEMQEKGVSMTELQIQLLQKVEELTLYIIQQDQRIKELESQLAK